MSIYQLEPGVVARCLFCRQNAVSVRELSGRTFDLRDEYDLRFDESMRVPICTKCGDVYVRGASLQRFSEVLERLYDERKRKAVEEFVSVIDHEFADVPRHRWEELLGVSPGYISRLLKGSRNLSTPLEVLMRGVTREPKQTLRMIGYSRRLPPALAARIK
jgi:hypothetical protein